MSAIIYGMYRFDWFAEKRKERILTIRIAPKKFEDGLFDEIFEKYWVKAEFLGYEGVKKEDLIQVSFGVSLGEETKVSEFISALQEKNDHEKISLGYGM